MNRTALRTALSVVALGASLTASSGVLAQGAAPKAAPPAAAPAAPAPAPAPVPVTPEARAAIKELLDVMNTRENLSKTFQAMGQTLPSQMAGAMSRQIETNPSLTPEQKVKLRDNMNQPFDSAVKEAIALVSDPKVVDQTIDKMYAIYAKYYTTPEIKQLVAFYKTPVGSKTLSVMPQAINESLQAGVGQFQPKINAVMERTLKTQIDAVSKK